MSYCNVPWISISGNLYRLAIMWIVCETLYLYVFLLLSLVGVWTDPYMRLANYTCSSLYTPRLSYVLKMWIDLLWGYQTLLRTWVVIKVAFGFVLKHAARHGQSRWDLPLSTWERYLWAPRVIGSRNAWPCYIRLRVNLVRYSGSQYREREVSLELDHISWGKGKRMYSTLWWFVRMIFICV